MKITHLCALVAALGLVAACGDNDSTSPTAASPAPDNSASTGRASTGASATTKTTPAETGAPGSLEEQKQGTNPVQGQVDPKEGEQRQGFQQRGDGAGPTSPETAPKPGR